MAFFILLAILFLILWLVERNKTKAYGNLKAEKEAADSYVASKQSEGNELFESKRREALDYYQKKTKSADERVKAAGLEVERLDKEKADLQQELLILNQDVLCAMVSVDDYANLKSDEIKNKLTLLKSQEDELIKSEKALEVTNTSSLKRVVDSQKKQILRCFNAEVTSVIGTITANNIDSVRTKLQRTFDALNKIFAVDGVQISQEYFAMKLEEMSLVYAYMLKVEEEKEQKKAIREQMLEEEKVRREIEREKQKIEKEESQFSNEVKKLMGYMQKCVCQ